MPFAIKHSKRIKVQGSLETLRLKTLYQAPPHLGEALSYMIQEMKIKIKEEEEEEEEEQEEEEEEEEEEG